MGFTHEIFSTKVGGRTPGFGGGVGWWVTRQSCKIFCCWSSRSWREFFGWEQIGQSWNDYFLKTLKEFRQGRIKKRLKQEILLRFPADVCQENRCSSSKCDAGTGQQDWHRETHGSVDICSSAQFISVFFFVEVAAGYIPAGRVELIGCRLQYVFVCLFIQFYIHLFIYQFIYQILFMYFFNTFIHSFIHSFVRSFIHSFICLFIYLLNLF